MIDKNIAVKAIPEEDYVFLVFKVDVGSREHVRVQAAERQDPETKDDFGGGSGGPVGDTGGSREPAGAGPGGGVGGVRRPYLESLAKNSK